MKTNNVMTPRRKQIRYITESEIIDVIYRAQKEAGRCLVGAIENDRIADAHYRSIPDVKSKLAKATLKRAQDDLRRKHHDAGKAAEHAREQAKKLSRRRHTLEDATIPRLGVALAEMRTMIMQPITTDPGVVLH